MKEWEKFQEEAAKRDHRKIGRVSIVITLKQLKILKLIFVINFN